MKTIIRNTKYTNEEFAQKANSVHNNVYDYSSLSYTNAHNFVTIICKKHGPFEQKAYSHLQGHGCIKCKEENIADTKRRDTNYLIDKAKEIHGTKYDYSKINNIKNIHTKVEIICPYHGSFMQTMGCHAYTGHGCKMCGDIRRLNYKSSKGEIEFLNYLEIPEENRQVPINKGQYYVDGVIGNVIYEYLGDYWHGHKLFEKGLNVIDCQLKRLTSEHRLNEVKRMTNMIIKYVWESDWKEHRATGCTLKIRTFANRLEFD